MDLAAEFYMQTIDQVFVKHQLPKGEMYHRGELIDLKAIRHVALMTVEGEKDDITGAGQTEAAIHLCANLPRSKKLHYTQPGVGHYGIFNGSRYKQELCRESSLSWRNTISGAARFAGSGIVWPVNGMWRTRRCLCRPRRGSRNRLYRQR